MTTYVAFLRAVNVGGKNTVPMAKLRDALTEAGLEDVATVLQSGNVVFRSRASASAAAKLVVGAIEDELPVQDRGRDSHGGGAGGGGGDQPIPRRRTRS